MEEEEERGEGKEVEEGEGRESTDKNMGCMLVGLAPTKTNVWSSPTESSSRVCQIVT